MRKEDFVFVLQLVESLEQAEKQMEIAYRNNDLTSFNKAKKFMIQVHKKIQDITR